MSLPRKPVKKVKSKKQPRGKTKPESLAKGQSAPVAQPRIIAAVCDSLAAIYPVFWHKGDLLNRTEADVSNAVVSQLRRHGYSASREVAFPIAVFPWQYGPLRCDIVATDVRDTRESRAWIELKLGGDCNKADRDLGKLEWITSIGDLRVFVAVIPYGDDDASIKYHVTTPATVVLTCGRYAA